MQTRFALAALAPLSWGVACAPPAEVSMMDVDGFEELSYDDFDTGFDEPDAAPQLKLDTQGLDFGKAEVGTRITHEIRIYNLGEGALHLDEIELEGEGFWLDQAPELDLLYSAEQTSLWLTFWSDESGTFEGELTFYSDDPDGPLTLELSGQSWGSLDDEENAEY